ncbi:VOC family protein [Promicromonospora vindobonensis]|uniref:VOC family protein n=1 Tax=Promicromonospora vindobonensis TaxID=195748 RepID=A0ABW5VY26_9MICO
MTVRIGRTSLLAKDIRVTAEFYREAFGFRTIYEGDNHGYPLLHIGPGGLADGGLWLHRAREGAPLGRQAGDSPFLVLYLDDAAEMDAVLKRCSRLGVEPHSPLRADDATGDLYAHVRDPDGAEIILAVITTS